jgi:transcriptional regulator with XRE-family HTH domain
MSFLVYINIIICFLKHVVKPKMPFALITAKNGCEITYDRAVMKFFEKLERLTAGKRVATADKANLKPAAVTNYISREQMPRADKAFAIAKALGVSLEWLLDDSQVWPPPDASSKLKVFTTDEIAAELGRRASGIGIALFAKIKRAKKIDWFALAERLVAHDATEKISDEVKAALMLPIQIASLASELTDFEPRFPLGEDAPLEALENTRVGFELTLTELSRRFESLEHLRGYEPARRLAQLLAYADDTRGKGFPAAFEAVRKDVASELQCIRIIEAARRDAASSQSAASKRAKPTHRTKPKASIS